MVEPGKYPAVVAKQFDEGREVACIVGQSTGKASVPCVSVDFQITAGEYEGKVLNWTGYFSGKATELVAKALVACGFEGDDLDQYPDQSPSNTVQIVVEHQEYPEGSGQFSPRIAFVNAPRQVKKLDDQGMRVLGASLKSILAAARAGAGQQNGSDTSFDPSSFDAQNAASPEAVDQSVNEGASPFDDVKA